MVRRYLLFAWWIRRVSCEVSWHAYRAKSLETFWAIMNRIRSRSKRQPLVRGKETKSHKWSKFVALNSSRALSLASRTFGINAELFCLAHFHKVYRVHARAHQDTSTSVRKGSGCKELERSYSEFCVLVVVKLMRTDWVSKPNFSWIDIWNEPHPISGWTSSPKNRVSPVK